MPAHQYEASLYATPPSGGVRFVFFAIPTGFVRVAHSTPWLFYAASPCGEARKFRSLRSPGKFPFIDKTVFFEISYFVFYARRQNVL